LRRPGRVLPGAWETGERQGVTGGERPGERERERMRGRKRRSRFGGRRGVGHSSFFHTIWGTMK
jgi:hypothetical protein